MIGKLLIANRGEIALRILRACRELQIPTVIIFSEADRNSCRCDWRMKPCASAPPSAKSYLSVPNIISAALITGCDAIHPGYGFLAEDRYFAEICGEYDLTFVGPSAEAIEKVANKADAKESCLSLGCQSCRVPMVRFHWRRRSRLLMTSDIR
jgi:acetyl-CoA carboxylase biotin carboxylase subunit